MILGQLAVDPKDDAIIEIVITAGTEAVSYNFSEVRMEWLPPPPPPAAAARTTRRPRRGCRAIPISSRS